MMRSMAMKGLLNMTDHRFGGIWTEVKLSAISEYSRFYTTALQKQDFKLWYIDAFAGTGSRTATRTVGGILDGVPIENVEERLDGSVLRAVSVTPPFAHLRLIEERASHYRALCDIVNANPQRDIKALRGDANQILPSLFQDRAWTSRSEGWSQRALVFLDPYGINVHWATLQALAATERADVWYLVNLKGITQQLPRKHSALDANKRSSMSDLFGTEMWEQELYAFEPPTMTLLGMMEAPSGTREADREKVGQFYRARLATLFRYVSDPLNLRVRSQDDYFQLYCLSNNPSDAARALIAKGANAVIRKHSKAFRQMSDL